MLGYPLPMSTQFCRHPSTSLLSNLTDRPTDTQNDCNTRSIRLYTGAQLTIGSKIKSSLKCAEATERSVDERVRFTEIGVRPS